MMKNNVGNNRYIFYLFVIFLVIGLFAFSSSAFAWISMQIDPVCVCADGKSKTDVTVIVTHPGDWSVTPPIEPYLMEGEEIVFSIVPPGEGYIDPKTKTTTTDYKGEASTTFTAGTKAERVTILAVDSKIGQNATGFVYAVKAEIKAEDGESAPPEYVAVNDTTSFKAKILPEGVPGNFKWDFKWQITSGKNYAQITAGADSQTVSVKGIKPSKKINDVTLKFKFKPAGAKEWSEPAYHSFSVIGVELANTTKEYVKVGNNLNISAVLTPSSATGGAWAWTTISPTCGGGGFTSANPTTLSGAGEGCIYPQASYTVNTATAKSKESKRILVYEDPGTNSAITPTSNPTTIESAGECSCEPDDPTLKWKAYFDASDKKWHVRVTGLECTGTIRIEPWPASGTPNPVPGGNVMQSNYQAIIVDLADYSSASGRGPVWHSTEASRAHENYHWNTDWMSTSIGTHWSGCEADLENLSIPEGTYCKASEAKTALEDSVNSRFSTFVNQCWSTWGPLPETGAYATGQAVLDGIIADIEQFAQGQGW